MGAIRWAVVLVFVASCGGGGGEATTAAEEAPATTVATSEATESGGGEVVSVDEIPEECMEAFVAFLQDIEPDVEQVDWANATTGQLEEIGTTLEPQTAAYESAIAGKGCEDIELDISDEEAFDFMIEMAEEEAPGTVGYLEWIRDFAAQAGQGGQGAAASGDCEEDIAAMQAIIDQGGTVADMTLTEVTSIGNLVTSISQVCSVDRSSEFFSQADVQEFLGTGG
ncbi:MAG: hypothetical protein ACT4OP_09165 [Actinomycetota bacterium]